MLEMGAGRLAERSWNRRNQHEGTWRAKREGPSDEEHSPPLAAGEDKIENRYRFVRLADVASRHMTWLEPRARHRAQGAASATALAMTSSPIESWPGLKRRPAGKAPHATCSVAVHVQSPSPDGSSAMRMP